MGCKLVVHRVRLEQRSQAVLGIHLAEGGIHPAVEGIHPVEEGIRPVEEGIHLVEEGIHLVVVPVDTVVAGLDLQPEGSSLEVVLADEIEKKNQKQEAFGERRHLHVCDL